MKKVLPSIVGICIFIIACKKSDNAIESPKEVQVTAAETATTSNLIENTRNVPVDAVFYNECCNEAVYVTGTAHFVNGNNIQHVEVNNITGVGLLTGFGYASLSPSVLTNVFYSDQVVGIFTFILNMKNENGCNFRLKATFQSHVNANGDITVSFENADTICH